jgi:hypothetical protein
MGRRDRRSWTLAVLAAAAALGGCGGTGAARTASTAAPATTGSTPTTPADPAKAAYIAQADAVCRDLRASLTPLQAQARTVAAEGDTPQGFAVAGAVSRRVAALEQAELTRLRGLRAPAGDGVVVASYLAQGQQAVAGVGLLAAAFAKGDETAIAAAEANVARTAARAKGLAQGYGLKVCGNGLAGNGL